MVRGADELESAFATFVSERVDAVVVQGSLSIKPDDRSGDQTPVFQRLRPRAHLRNRRLAVVRGGWARRFPASAPKFVHRILQGKHPKDMPIEQPTKFDLAVNLKTAKAIAYIPEAFLLRADAVIE